MKPAAGEGFGGGFRIFEIAFHDDIAAEHDLTERISIGDNRLGGWYGYRASKAALNMLLKTASIELARRNAQMVVVGLHPGTVDSPLSKPFQSNVKPGKLFRADFAADKLLDVLDGLQPGDSGGCFAWDGERVPT